MASVGPSKRVSVTFCGDDDVIQHIVNVSDRKAGRKVRARSSTTSRRVSQASYLDDVKEEEDENEADVFKTATALQEEANAVVGRDVFTFHTPKKSGQMLAKASEAVTPKTPKSAPATSSPRTPRSAAQRKSAESSTPSSALYRVRKTGRKPETTTPYKINKRNAMGDGSSSDEYSDEESSSSDGSSDSVDIMRRKVPSKSVPPAKAQSMKAMPEVTDNVQSMVQDYFDLHSSSGVGPTSDKTLAKLGAPKMDTESLNEMLADFPISHKEECSRLMTDYVQLFNKWMFTLCNGYNLLLYGVGSKRLLLEKFRQSTIKDFTHLVINGYFPSLTIKQILNCITEDIMCHECNFRTPMDQCDFIKAHFTKQEYQDVYLIIHNIDGVMLRAEKVQNVLSILSQVPGFHILASIDHINAPLIWDKTKSSRFNWLWHNVTTYLPYFEETCYENSLLVQQSGALVLSSLIHVMRSLTPNARGIFLLLAQHQLENKDNPAYTGLSFQDLYQRCREAFLVASDLTLRTQLTEFRDHKLIRSKKGYDGLDYLLVAVDEATLLEYMQSHEQS